MIYHFPASITRWPSLARPLMGMVLLSMLGCDWLEELPDQPPLSNTPPETYLSVTTDAVIYATIDYVDCSTGGCDTVWTYYFEGDTNLPADGLDTLQHALQTTLTSRQTLHWWGEDPDGDVIGYYIRWNTQSGWATTTAEDSTFIVPIRQDSNLFSFAVKAIDNDSLVDLTPATLVLPIKNTPPVVAFRYRSNPIVANPQVVHRTYPTRTFIWDVSDADGRETVDSIYWALDDTTSWNALDAMAYSSITLADSATPFALDGIGSVFLTDLSDTTHIFYLKAKDIAGAESPVIQFPDTLDESTPDTWRVIPVVGEVLLVDDFVDDQLNNYALNWYQSILDTIPGVGAGNYSVWKIGEDLPYSGTDVLATLSYFKYIVWFAAISGTETYDEASNSIYRFLQSGGHLWINVTELSDTTLIWFPFDSKTGVNPVGRRFAVPGKRIEHEWDSTLDLVTSLGIFYRFNSFALNDTSALDSLNGPHYQVIYRLQEPGDADLWVGQPILAAEYDHRSLQTPNAGKVILSTIPLHGGTDNGALLEGEGTAGKFISWALRERFMK